LIALQLAGSLTGIATLVGACAALLTSMATFAQSRRTNGRVEDVHAIVNSRSDASDDRIDQLSQSLQAHGVDIPASPPRNEGQ
jgi:hypothetical protein